MKRESTLVALLLLVSSFLPLVSISGEHSRNLWPEGGATPKSEPEIASTSIHLAYAEYDFSNTFIFSRWSVVMEPNKASLMKQLTVTNDTWAQCAQLPADYERAWHVAVYDDADDMVIVEGGTYYHQGMASPNYSRSLVTCNLSTGNWTDRGQSMLPTSPAGVWDSREGCLIVCGGMERVSGNLVSYNQTWAWYPGNGTWVRLSDMPAARYAQCAAYDPLEGVMLVFGGTDGNGYFNGVWAFRPGNNTWTVLSPEGDELPLPRAYSSAVWNGARQEMVVHAGEDNSITFLSTWAYSYRNNTWIHRTSAPYARSMQAACYDTDRNVMLIAAAGGSGNNDSWSYDTASDSWAMNAPLPGVFRAGASGVYDPVRRQMLVIGGRDSASRYLGEMWSLTPGEMEGDYYSDGYLLPPVLDMGSAFHSLDRVSWTGNVPQNTSVSLRLRTSQDNITWRPYTAAINNSRPSSQGRYLEWNMSLFASPDNKVTPEIFRVRFEYTTNALPSCSAGANVTVFKRQGVLLNASAGDPDGDSLRFSWTRTTGAAGQFDNSSILNPVYTPLDAGVHILRLAINDSYGTGEMSYIRIIAVNRPPSVSAGQDRDGYKKENITLEGNASDPDGDDLRLSWVQLGGPPVPLTPDTGQSAVFFPRNAGYYIFSLKADDGDNATYAYVNITVLNRPPVASLEANPLTVNINERVNFSAQKSFDPDGELTRYFFDFGDGNITGWTNVSSMGYQYTAPGIYNATVRTSDDDGNISAASLPVTINVVNALPVAIAVINPVSGNTTVAFQFRASPGSFDPDGNIASYEWDFGDGSTLGGPSVTYSYARAGNFRVGLRVTDDFGAFSEWFLYVNVSSTPPVIISTAPSGQYRMNLTETAVFSVYAQDPYANNLVYYWKIDGAAVSEHGRACYYKPGKTGQHTVSVQVTNGQGNLTHTWNVTVINEIESTGPAATMVVAAGAGVLLAAVAGAYILTRKKKSVSRRRRRPGKRSEEE